MSKKKISLGSGAMSNLILGQFAPPFTFYVNESAYVSNINAACAISNKICRLLRGDPTTDSFSFTVPYKDALKKFTQFMGLVTSFSIIITEENYQCFHTFATILETEDFFKATRHININPKQSLDLMRSGVFDEGEFQYAVEHLMELINKKSFFEVDIDILKQVLDQFCRSDSNDEANNRSIFEFLKNYENDFVYLATSLRFDLLKDSEINYFLSLVNSRDEGSFGEIMYSLHQWFSVPRSSSRPEVICRCEDDKLIHGIFYRLKKVLKGNPILEGAVKIISKAPEDQLHPLSNLLEYSLPALNYFYNNYSINSAAKHDQNYFTFDFLSKCVTIDAYILRTSNGDKDWYHPKSWKIMGSNCGQCWDTLDEVVDNEDLNSKFAQKKFFCENNRKYYRFIRYLQLKHHSQIYHNNIELTAIEFFGAIRPND